MLCYLCDKPIKGKGYNPEPITDDGRCCYECHINEVLPSKMKELGFNVIEVIPTRIEDLLK
jgi:hypothetical protein